MSRTVRLAGLLFQCCAKKKKKEEFNTHWHSSLLQITIITIKYTLSEELGRVERLEM